MNLLDVVTRATKRLKKTHGIKKSLYVSIKRCRAADCLAWLNKPSTSSNPFAHGQSNSSMPKKKMKRRYSVAGGDLYSVNNQIRESGFDYLPKIPQPNVAIASTSGISNSNSSSSARSVITNNSIQTRKPKCFSVRKIPPYI